jgi:hypothetical protein
MAPALALDVNQVQRDLQGQGSVGWIHGAVTSQNLYVFTVRNPQNFFDYAEFSLISDSVLIQNLFSSLDRHDQVRIKGDFLDQPIPQKHIDVQSIEVLTPYKSGFATQPYHHEAQIPEELEKNTEANFLVHAIADDGAVMVLEYKDAVVPVFVKNPSLTKNLYRGDLIHLKYKIQKKPSEPTHLNIDETQDRPLQVLESIVNGHGQKITLQGRLILFPMSPEIRFNVFAVEQPLQSGLKRQYTLVNFDDPVLFQKIRESLQAAWDRHPTDYVNGRNKLVSQAVQVKVTGIKNEIDPSQANPQVLISNLADLQIIE